SASGTPTHLIWALPSTHYVDKTGFALRLLAEGTHYFLSRPRRFGKSLFVDTLKELFEGSRELFEGLKAYDRWDWSVSYPVVRLEFGRGNYAEPSHLHVDLMALLDGVERRSGVRSRYETTAERFADLLEALHARSGQRVVVLVDEYDKPILDALHKPDIAMANRDYLRGVYSVIKSCDAHVRFCLLTGVTRFSKASLFSGLNNLRDITLNPQYSSICGFAESDLDAVFAPELEGLDRNQIGDWYCGYSWGGAERVYNPFAVLLLLADREFKPWWYETGSPTFLIRHLAENGVRWDRLDGLRASEQLLSTFDVGSIAPEALLFQTGYLTLLGREERYGRLRYRLGFPNREVRESLNRTFLNDLLGSGSHREDQEDLLFEVLQAGNLDGLREVLRALLAGIPHQWHGRNPMAEHEGFYASVLYAHFSAVGADVRAEESGSAGRADLCVRVFGRVYVFEFKMQGRGGTAAAMAQLKARGYADRYRALGEPIHLVAVEFSPEKRNLTGFETETI
ncbi:MAG: AAA family ATPase, partial [Bryobacterales bacterium]|nr:AAA family ATPase [Bryobacterales bacterium]